MEPGSTLLASMYAIRIRKNTPTAFHNVVRMNNLELAGFGCFTVQNFKIIIENYKHAMKNFISLNKNRCLNYH